MGGLYQSGRPLGGNKEVAHPNDPFRRLDQPKIHYGTIGSANTLLKNPKARDALRKDLDFLAVEMEGSGIADGAWVDGKWYILIRGISDYCDLHKDDPWQGRTDVWQGYAAAAAAAYARALIETFPAPKEDLLHEQKIIRQLVIFLKDREVLTAPPQTEHLRWSTKSVLEIRRELVMTLQSLGQDSEAIPAVEAMRLACVIFLRRRSWLNLLYRRPFEESLVELRQVFVEQLNDLASRYAIENALVESVLGGGRVIRVSYIDHLGMRVSSASTRSGSSGFSRKQ
jgi:hypothetical protein